jgi:hypothetical protein
VYDSNSSFLPWSRLRSLRLSKFGQPSNHCTHCLQVKAMPPRQYTTHTTVFLMHSLLPQPSPPLGNGNLIHVCAPWRGPSMAFFPSFFPSSSTPSSSTAGPGNQKEKRIQLVGKTKGKKKKRGRPRLCIIALPRCRFSWSWSLFRFPFSLHSSTNHLFLLDR